MLASLVCKHVSSHARALGYSNWCPLNIKRDRYSTEVVFRLPDRPWTFSHQQARTMASGEEFYVRYYVGHKGKFGHEFLEFEFRPDGMHMVSSLAVVRLDNV